MSHKRIVWKSWNEQANTYLDKIDQETLAILEMMNAANEEVEGGGYIPASAMGGTIQTPLGVFPIDSMFKPSDRWACWIGTTNFDITHNMFDVLKNIEGIECLRILGRYTFIVGIPCTFTFRDVRISIEKEFCVYTEDEVVKGDTRLAVNLLKEQIKTSNHWSIFVGKEGSIDYIVGDQLDSDYLEGLRDLDETKQLIGGIILRGDNG
tara:strand:+ start:445 stop:1068 length:624 start_codon:yes stop_codon:yes gene_type:complete